MLADIKKLTLKELVTERPDLIQAIKNNEDEGKTVCRVEKDEKKRIKKWTEETRNINGILLSKRVDEYSYYKTGEIDVIILQVYNGEEYLASEKRIKHFVDGRKPEIKQRGNLCQR